MGPAQLAALMVERLETGDGLNAFLLTAALRQVIEDIAEPDVLRLAAVQRVVSGPLRSAVRSVAEATSFFVARRLGALDGLDRAIGTLLDGLANALADGEPHATLLSEAREISDAISANNSLNEGLCRPPTAFQAFDQHPDDLRLLASRLARRPLSGRVVVVGVRTSGSFLAPLLAAFLRKQGTESEATTLRPHVPMRAAKRAMIKRSDTVVLIDDAPASGESLAAAAAAVERLGLSPQRIVLAWQALSDDGRVPDALRCYASEILRWGEWSVHGRLEPEAVERTLREMQPGLTFEAIERLTFEGPPDRGHIGARYRLMPGEGGGSEMLVKGAGLGYLATHCLAVEQALPEWIPPVHGVADGLVYRPWIPEGRRAPVAPEFADEIAGYVLERRSRLPVAADVTGRLRGQDPVWEVASTLLSQGFARAWRVARIVGLDALMRDLLRSRKPSIVDGRMGHGWFVGVNGHSAIKLNASERAFSSRNLACSDAIYDLATAAVAWPEQESAVREAFERRDGNRVDEERWLLFRLVALWASQRDGDLAKHDAQRAQARVLQDYLASVLLDDVAHVESGPLCAIDLDGVLETEALGFLSTSPAGALAMRALLAHGYQPVLVSGRSASEVAERCRRYGLSSGVAEYGAALVGGIERNLFSPAQAEAMGRVRDRIGKARGVTLGPDHSYVVRAWTTGPDGQRGPLSHSEIEAARSAAAPVAIRPIAGDDQTDLVPASIDKGTGIMALLDEMGAEPPLAFAIGDTAEDLPMLRLARLPAAPANATDAVRDAGVRVSRRGYQSGLFSAVGDLLGHHPGDCPRCRPDPVDRRRRALMHVLGAGENGRRGLLLGLIRLGVDRRR